LSRAIVASKSACVALLLLVVLLVVVPASDAVGHGASSSNASANIAAKTPIGGSRLGRLLVVGRV
jgi:hypothetical protein